MKILLDINVLLDVIQRREPHYEASAAVLSLVYRGDLTAYIPGHALTTIHYILARYASPKNANEAVDWLLEHLYIAPEDHVVFTIRA